MIIALFLAGAAGFIFLGYELLWFRIFNIASGSLPVVFGLVLSVYLSGLAVGAFAGGRFLKKDPETGWRFAAAAMLLAAGVCWCVVPGTAAFAGMGYTGWKAGFFLLFAATAVSGGILPALAHAASGGTGKPGKAAGFVFAANTLGSVAGTILTGYILIDSFALRTLNTVFSVGLVILSVLTGIMCISKNRGGLNGKKESVAAYFAAAILLCAAILTGGGLHGRLYEKLCYKMRWRYVPPFEHVVETRSGVICVDRDGTVLGDGVYDGSLSTALVDKRNMEIDHAYLAMKARPGAERVLEIGVATGAWANVVLAWPSVENLTAVEINPGYRTVMEKEPEVSGILDDPRFRLVMDDGRRWLRANPEERFDLILLNTTFHYRNHATNLLSTEFLQLVKSRLTPGGVIYLNTTGSPESLKTAAECFAHIMRRGVYCIASESPFEFDEETFGRELADLVVGGRRVFEFAPGEKERIMRGGEPESPSGKAFERMCGIKFEPMRADILESLEDAGVITDDNMITEFRANKR